MKYSYTNNIKQTELWDIIFLAVFSTEISILDFLQVIKNYLVLDFVGQTFEDLSVPRGWDELIGVGGEGIQNFPSEISRKTKLHSLLRGANC